MATERQQPETFEDVDWEEIEGERRFSLSLKTKLFLAMAVSFGSLWAYDYFAVNSETPTFEPLVGWKYNVTEVDWLFGLTICLLFIYAVLPMIQNPRMTRYYWDRFKQNRPAVLSMLYLIGLFCVGTFVPLILSSPEISVLDKYQPPVYTSVSAGLPIECAGEVSDGMCHGTWEHPLGTSANGKSMLKLVVYGMQISLKVGLIPVLIVITLGSVVGTVGAYAGGLVDEILFRYVDIQQVFPAFILFLILSFLFGPTLLLFILIFGFLGWEGTARYVRSNALQKAEEEYIKASKLSGASTFYIVRRHMIPNTASSIVTQATLAIPGFILFEAALSFLAFGDPTIPSWGQTIANGRSDLGSAWWIATMPGVALFVTILAFNFMGYALLDAINPEAETEAN
jgi:peptide/nickel transport system permease protein